MTRARLEAFADGIFAIAATLLILDVGVPAALNESLGRELLSLWPQYFAYVVSFLTIGIMWVNHHRIMRQLERVDEPFVFLNIGLLLCIAFVPFPTRVLAEFVRTDDGNAAAVLYGISMTRTGAGSCIPTPTREWSAGSRGATCRERRSMPRRPWSGSSRRKRAPRSTV
ncbi:MAG: DUF1211 domain-containing protein [Actinobacteria bacterium]|nr:MAG: DUF1211 domain-containing protein [Actinomycetota bacterium]